LQYDLISLTILFSHFILFIPFLHVNPSHLRSLSNYFFYFQLAIGIHIINPIMEITLITILGYFLNVFYTHPNGYLFPEYYDLLTERFYLIILFFCNLIKKYPYFKLNFPYIALIPSDSMHFYVFLIISVYLFLLFASVIAATFLS